MILDPRPKNLNFFDHHCKGKVFTAHFLCRKFSSNVFGVSSVAAWMDATGFPRLRKNRLSPKGTS